jgi:hypothetical protein
VSTATAASHVTLSKTRPDRTRGLSAFTEACSWVDRPADFGGDQWLLTLLDERCRWLQAERHGHSHLAVIRDSPGAPELPRVGELPAEWIVPIVEDVQARYPGWRLAGDEHQPIHDRLDAHFARRQEARQLEVAAREARDRDDAARRRDAEAEADRQAAEQTRELYGLETDPD